MNGFVSTFHFLRPWWLLAGPFVIALWFWLRAANQSGQVGGDAIASHLARQLMIRPERKQWLTPIRLLIPVWLLSVVAMAGPTFRRHPSPFADDKAAIVIVLRVAQSMTETDLPPSRMERARAKLASLLSRRGKADTGLVAYNGTAHLAMPITDDPDVINHMIEALDPSVMPREGDALVEAIELADQQLVSSGKLGSILVVTDSASGGVSAAGDLTRFPVQFLAIARDESRLQASGIPGSAEQLDAPVQLIASDDSDVELIDSRCSSDVISASIDDASDWRDDGYRLVPLLLLGCLPWARRGWSIRA